MSKTAENQTLLKLFQTHKMADLAGNYSNTNHQLQVPIPAVIKTLKQLVRGLPTPQ
jgi:hypothetical protein